ncbi:MAG: Exo-alpha-sialidase, partial [Chloroflexi bacterium]|nr:Exo-alpha-sialidase [Chloroflexota bacterium]
GYNVVFMKSTNHGTTWSAPVKTYGNVSWNDKPVLAMSDDGKDVYISFNGPTGGDPWVAQSHDFGATWTQRKLTDSARYIFAFDADVAPDGTVYFAETSILYGGGGNKGTTPASPIEEHVYVSTDKGVTFTDRLVASVQPGLACVAAGCTPDYYLGHSALAVDATGRVVLLYDGAAVAGGPQTTVAVASTNRGTSWTAPVTLSAAGTHSVSPAVEARGTGDFRAWYMQTTGVNPDVWNVYYRRSTDGGLTWGTAVRISDAGGGAVYKTAAGFAEVYGDYGEIAITSTGKTIAIWGEGASYTGPGGVWFNREP